MAAVFMTRTAERDRVQSQQRSNLFGAGSCCTCMPARSRRATLQLMTAPCPALLLPDVSVQVHHELLNMLWHRIPIAARCSIGTHVSYQIVSSKASCQPMQRLL